MLSASDDGTVRVWDLVSEESARPCLRPAAGGQQWVRNLSYRTTPNHSATLAIGRFQGVKVWDCDRERDVLALDNEPGGISVELDRAGRRLLCAGSQTLFGPPPSTVFAKVFDVGSGRETARFPHDSELTAAALSLDGTRVATGTRDGAVRIWDADTGGLLHLWHHRSGVTRVMFSHDGRLVATASLDESARVWRVEDGQPVTAPLRHAAFVVNAVFSPDDTRLATASADATARVWDVTLGAASTPPLRHTGPVWDAQFSPDGRLVVTASADQTAQIWDVRTGARVGQAMNHRSQVDAALFSPSGRFVATAAHHAGGRVWDGLSGEAVSPPLERSYLTWRAVFSPDERTLATGCHDATVRLWNIAADELPFAEMRQLAELLGGCRVTAAGGTEPLTSAQLQQRWQAVRGNAAFSRFLNISSASLGRWRESQAADAESEGHYAAVLFHSSFAPESSRNEPKNQTRNAECWMQLGRLDKAALFDPRFRIPARPATAATEPSSPGPHAVNLESCYNRPLLPEFDSTIPPLHPGFIRCDGMPFDVRGAIRLDRARRYKTALWELHAVLPAEVSIPVEHRAARRLHFLHTAASIDPAGTVLGQYVIRYQDGLESFLDIRYGTDIANTWVQRPPVLATQATPYPVGAGDAQRLLFQRSWDNPRPGVAISAIRFRTSLTRCSLLLLGVTLEE